MVTIPAYSINGFTRPELILDGFGNIVLDDTASAFVQTYGLRALYIGCPPSTPYPPVLPSLLFPTDTNGAPNTVAEGAAANTTGRHHRARDQHPRLPGHLFADGGLVWRGLPDQPHHRRGVGRRSKQDLF